MKDIQYIEEKQTFNCRVAGTCLKDNKILLCRFKDGDYWTFVGGKVQFDETTEDAVIRELKEETKATLSINHLVSIVENFFTIDDSRWHQFLYLYLLNDDNNELKIFEGEREILDEPGAFYKWFDITQLDSINLKPKCLINVLKQLNEKNIIHIINRDN